MKELHQDIRDNMDNLCHTLEVCGECRGSQCMIGYCKAMNERTLELKPPHLKGSSSLKPVSNIRPAYDEDDLLKAISMTLLQCKQCTDRHTDDCILAVVRDCLEKLEFGEEIEYKGNPLTYLMDAQKVDSVKASALLEIFNSEKEKA